MTPYYIIPKGGRARDFEEAIEWLLSASMLNRIYNVSKMEPPLSAFDRLDQFKLFLFDTGLLKHMAGIDNSAILLKADYQFKGPLTENYVLQQLCGQFEAEPPITQAKPARLTSCCSIAQRLSPLRQKVVKVNPRLPSSGISRGITPNTPSVFPSAGIGRTAQPQISRCICHGKQKICSNQKGPPCGRERDITLLTPEKLRGTIGSTPNDIIRFKK